MSMNNNMSMSAIMESTQTGTISFVGNNTTIWTLPVIKNLACVYSPVIKMKDNSDARLSLITWIYNEQSQNNCPPQKYRNITIQLKLTPEAARDTAVRFTLGHQRQDGSLQLSSTILYCLMGGLSSSIISWCVDKLQVNYFQNFNDQQLLRISFNTSNLSDLKPVNSNSDYHWIRENIMSRNQPLVSKVNFSNCRDNYERLLTSGEFSDLKIYAVGGEINCHKVILSTRNRKFKDMIKDSTEKEQVESIKIDNIEIDVMQEILQYIYSGKVKNIENMVVIQMPSELINKALKILPHAVDYELSGIVSECERAVIDNLNVDNIKGVLEILNKEEKLDRLRKLTINYLKKNEQLNTVTFREFIKKLNDKLFDEIIDSLWKKDV